MRAKLVLMVAAILTVTGAAAVVPAVQPGGYDPLAPIGPNTRGAAPPQRRELVVHDEARSRDIPVLVYLPAGGAACPIVLFSHGLGGSRDMGVYLGEHWASRGYVAVFLQHPGSDTGVWQGKGRGQARAALLKAASAQNLVLRVQDVRAVLDQLERWQAATGRQINELSGRLDLQRMGMSGHSFGAITTQSVSGAAMPAIRDATDARIKAALPMSPSVPMWATSSPSRAFGAVKIPWMVMTGTRDDSPIGNTSATARLAVFDALPPPSKYELVLDGAEHSAFTDRALPGDRDARNPNHHRVILALSTAFWDAHLRGDAAARAWLDGPAARSVMQSGDGWRRK